MLIDSLSSWISQLIEDPTSKTTALTVWMPFIQIKICFKFADPPENAGIKRIMKDHFFEPSMFLILTSDQKERWKTY
jgi:hypothetical protein